MTDDQRVPALLAQINNVLSSLVILESIEDDRTYTTLDLIEAITITETVFGSRFADGIGDWKDDNKHGYACFFNSVREETATAIQNAFVRTGSRPIRLVDTYNRLVLQPLYQVLQSMGPDGASNMLPMLCQSFIEHVSSVEILDPEAELTQAKKVLSSYRKQRKQHRKLSKEERLDLIRILFEKVAEQVA